uniref:SD19743p n=1 Tax=Drosophila melanogaster TaxID=7227 RepID=Q5BIL7_DROME|nr:SD19743p [Drosophila melanogaster]
MSLRDAKSTCQHSEIAPAPENNKRLINKNIKFSAQGASASAAGTGTGTGQKQYSPRTPTERTAPSVEAEKATFDWQELRGQRIRSYQVCSPQE